MLLCKGITTTSTNLGNDSLPYPWSFIDCHYCYSNKKKERS